MFFIKQEKKIVKQTGVCSGHYSNGLKQKEKETRRALAKNRAREGGPTCECVCHVVYWLVICSIDFVRVYIFNFNKKFIYL